MNIIEPTYRCHVMCIYIVYVVVPALIVVIVGGAGHMYYTNPF